MMAKQTYIDAGDAHRIALHVWALPADTSAKGVVHWLHGMAEHGGRHDQLAEHLNRAGWHLVCHDHRGHGLSADRDGPLGHFADDKGWQKVQSDIARVQQWIALQFAGLPVVLAGHSMGSFMARDYAEHINQQGYPAVSGLIFCGSDYQPPIFYRLMRLFLYIDVVRLDKRAPGKLAKALTFSAWNKRFKPNRTDFDWLSTDQAAVDAYMQDPLCGQDSSIQLWNDLTAALKQMEAPSALGQLPSRLPTLLIGGNSDPVGRNGKGMAALACALRKHSEVIVTAKQFSGRHEILHEHCRDDVIDTIIDWLSSLMQRG